MTQDEQRIAIAEECGWKDCDGFELGGKWKHFPSGRASLDIPDYLNDLNAMREAEKILYKGRVPTEYLTALFEAVDKDYQHEAGGLEVLEPSEIYCILVHATAAQRAEAFLRTIGKWKE